MNNQKNDLPLYATFNSLKKNGFDLGIEEYYVFLDALHGGFRFDNTESHFSKKNLLWLAKTVWLKPNQSKYEFEKIFNDTFEQINKPSETKNDKLPNQESTQKSEKLKDIEEDKSQQDKKAKSDEKTESKEEHLIKFVLGNTDENSEKSSFDMDNKYLKRNFLFTENYFDISQRQIKQSFRSLPIFQPSSISNEIDIEETLQHWAKKGFFEKPIFKRKNSLYNNVVLLTDNKGSMLSFELLGDMLNTALSESFNGQTTKKSADYEQYFFYNVPQKYFYKDKIHIKYKKNYELLNQIKRKKSLVLIYSDAGAARGGNSDGRFKPTLRFLLHLKKVAHQVVWLNPLPKERWNKTTAKRISRFVDMFSLTDSVEYTEKANRNLQKAIHTLQGKQM
jgi:hypothetical protein